MYVLLRNFYDIIVKFFINNINHNINHKDTGVMAEDIHKGNSREVGSQKDKFEAIKKAQLDCIRSLDISLDFEADILNKDLLEKFVKHVGKGIDWELFPSYTNNLQKKHLSIDFADTDDINILRLLFEDKVFFNNWVHCVRLYIYANDNVSDLYSIRFQKVVQSFVGMCYGCTAHLYDQGIDIEKCTHQKFDIFKNLCQGLSCFQSNIDDTNYVVTFKCFDSFKEKFGIKKCEDRNIINDHKKIDGQLDKIDKILKKESGNTLLGKILAKIKDMFSNMLSMFVSFFEFLGLKNKDGEKDIHVVGDIKPSSSLLSKSTTLISQDCKNR